MGIWYEAVRGVACMHVSMRYGVSGFSGYICCSQYEYFLREVSHARVFGIDCQVQYSAGFPDGELHQRTLLDVYFLFLPVNVIC